MEVKELIKVLEKLDPTQIVRVAMVNQVLPVKSVFTGGAGDVFLETRE